MFSVKQGQESEFVWDMVNNFLFLVLFKTMLGEVHSYKQFVQCNR